MSAAAAASTQPFGMPVLVAWSQALPFRSGVFDAGWSLGVLCTVGAAQSPGGKRQLLAEARRVLAPTGRLGLLV